MLFRSLWDVTFPAFALGWFAAVLLLFLRPVQVWVLGPLLGARHPSRDQMAVLVPAWRAVLQAVDLPARRYVLAVLPSHELNAFACGGHLRRERMRRHAGIAQGKAKVARAHFGEANPRHIEDAFTVGDEIGRAHV